MAELLLKMSKNIFNFMNRIRKAREIGFITEFLVNNQTFRKAALTFHNTKTGGTNSLFEYLDKELLDKEPTKRIETNDKQSS